MCAWIRERAVWFGDLAWSSHAQDLSSALLGTASSGREAAVKELPLQAGRWMCM
jgi:hypothetical protein